MTNKDIDAQSISTDDVTVTREFNPAQTDSIQFLDTPAPPGDYFNPTTSGSGFAASVKRGVLLFGTGGTQGSRGEMWLSLGGDNDAAPPTEITDWSKDRVWRCYVSVTDVDELIRFGMGLLRDGEQSIGFTFDSGSLYAVSEDKATKNRTEINATPATGAYDFEMRFVAGSRVEYYIDGTKQTEHTASLPSGNSRATFLIAGRAENPNSATDARAGYERTEVVVKA
jgi:hypothetical protein